MSLLVANNKGRGGKATSKSQRGTKTIKSDGLAFEKFVEGLTKQVHKNEQLETKVEHNKTDLIGNSGCAHQVDLYLEFNRGGIKYKTIIECKHYKQSVEIGQVRDFFGVLNDNPGVSGIFVSSVGFQKGAIQFAKHYKIDLRIIHPLTAKQGELLRDSRANDSFSTRNIEVDQVLINFYQSAGRKPVIDVDLSIYPKWKGDVPVLYNNDGSIYKKAADIGNDILQSEKAQNPLTIDAKGYLAKREEGSLCPVDSIDVTYREIIHNIVPQEIGAELAKAVIRNLEDGSLIAVYNDGLTFHTSKRST